MRILYIVLLLTMLGSCKDRSDKHNKVIETAKEIVLVLDARVDKGSISIGEYCTTNTYIESSHKIKLLESGKYVVSKGTSKSYLDRSEKARLMYWTSKDLVMKYCVVNSEEDVIRLHWCATNYVDPTKVKKIF